MIRTMVEQILGTIPNKEVYPDHYIVGEHGEYSMIVFKDNDGIKGFSLYIPQEKEKEYVKGKRNV